jgi:hypothetical protein
MGGTEQRAATSDLKDGLKIYKKKACWDGLLYFLTVIVGHELGFKNIRTFLWG